MKKKPGSWLKKLFFGNKKESIAEALANGSKSGEGNRDVNPVDNPTSDQKEAAGYSYGSQNPEVYCYSGKRVPEADRIS